MALDVVPARQVPGEEIPPHNPPRARGTRTVWSRRESIADAVRREGNAATQPHMNTQDRLLLSPRPAAESVELTSLKGFAVTPRDADVEDVAPSLTGTAWSLRASQERETAYIALAISKRNSAQAPDVLLRLLASRQHTRQTGRTNR